METENEDGASLQQSQIADSMDTEHSRNHDPITKGQARDLYLSHALSTWNARTYEFAAILFTASAFPDTLLASSIRGLFLQVTALLLSPTVGEWIDRSPSRIRPLVVSIISNRLSILAASVFWYLLLDRATSVALRPWLFLAAISFGACEKMSGIGNMIAMERDWIPVVADLSIVGDTTVYTLTRLNAVMRRIDLACKLVAPIVISAIVIGYSVRVGILVVAVVNALSWAIELWCTQRVWRSIARLRAPKITEGGIWTQSNSHQPRWSITRLYGVVSDTTKQFLSQLRFYFSTNVWIPSLALSILHINVLTYRDTFVTYLLAAGFSLTTITIARTCGSIIEVSSTYIAPVSIDRLAETRKEEELESGERLLQEDSQKIFEKKHDIGLTRSGLWGIVFQFANLLPVAISICLLIPAQDVGSIEPSGLSSRLAIMLPTSSPSIISAITMFTFLSFSRLGLWVFDLTTQEITQIHVPADRRSAFAGIEMSFSSFFELMQYVVSAVVNKPKDFPWLALGGVICVGISTLMYTFWVRRQRGHLLHWDSLRRIAISCSGA